MTDINASFVKLKSASEIPTEAIPNENGYFFYYDGGILKKAPLSVIYGLVGGVSGYLKISDPKPTVAGKYELVGVGTFANLIPNIKPGETTATNTPITTKEGYFNTVFFDGTNFTFSEIEMPSNPAKAPQWVAGTYQSESIAYNKGNTYRAKVTTTQEPIEGASDWGAIDGRVDDLQKDINGEKTETELKQNVIQGSFTYSANLTAGSTALIAGSSKYGYIDIDVVQGDVFKISTIVQDTTGTVFLVPTYLFVDSAGKLVDNATTRTNQSVTDLQITVPANAVKLRVNVYNANGWVSPYTAFSVKKISQSGTGLKTKVENNTNRIEILENATPPTVNIANDFGNSTTSGISQSKFTNEIIGGQSEIELKQNVIQGQYAYSANGAVGATLLTASSSKYGYIVVDVTQGDVFKISSIITSPGGSPQTPLYAFVDVSGKLAANTTSYNNISTLGNNAVTVTTPTNAVKLYINIYNVNGWASPETLFSVKKIATVKGIKENVATNSADITSLKTKVETIPVDDLSIVYKKYPLPIKNTSYATVYGDASQINTTSGITSPSAFPAVINSAPNPLFTYSAPIKYDGLYPYTMVSQNSQRQIGYGIEFYADSQWIEIIGSGSYRVVIIADGIILNDKISTTSDGATRYLRVDFGTKKKRHIQLSYFGKFAGINTESGGIVSKFDKIRPLMITEGDSIVEGAVGAINGDMWLYSWAGILAQKLGFGLLNSAVGGSGYLKTGGGGQPNMLDRLNDYVLVHNPKIFIASAGLNDSAQPLEGLKNNIDNYWDTVKTSLPNSFIIAVSPFNPNATYVTNIEDISEWVRLAALRNRIPFIDILHSKTYDSFGNLITNNSGGFLSNLITGTGKAGDVTNPNNGNRFYYISSDNTHPTTEGYRYIGLRITAEVYKLLLHNQNYLIDSLPYRG